MVQVCLDGVIVIPDGEKLFSRQLFQQSSCVFAFIEGQIPAMIYAVMLADCRLP